ncbi:MAG: hypothetical protein IT353_02450 [Gemmatimonadaceae bacterium]|nr:hypothetical protein [Gemmatimonadaceae bacterium]
MAQHQSLSVAEYTLGDAPSVVIGDTDAVLYSFDRASARRLASGNIAVADQGTITIRLFSPDGHLLRTLATRGEGPGEINGPFTMTVSADTIIAIGQPPRSRRGVQLYTESGTIRRLVPLSAAVPTLQALDRVSSGAWLVEQSRGFRIITETPQIGTLRPDSTKIGLLFEGSSATPSRYVNLPVGVREWFYAYPWIGGPIPAAEAPFVFGPRALIAVSGTIVWRVQSDEPAVEQFDTTGARVLRESLPIAPDTLSAKGWAKLLAIALASFESRRDSLRITALYDASILPKSPPLFARALAGSDGELWLERWSDGSSKTRDFVGVSARGRLLATLRVPSAFEIQQIGRDFALGVRRAPDGTESIAQYPLVRP